MRYDLSFDVYSTLSTAPSAVDTLFQASFAGAMVLSLGNVDNNWIHYTFTGLLATVTATELKFGVRNDPSFTRLDNVSVTASPVPEPAEYALLGGIGLLGFGAFRRFGKGC